MECCVCKKVLGEQERVNTILHKGTAVCFECSPKKIEVFSLSIEKPGANLIEKNIEDVVSSLSEMCEGDEYNVAKISMTNLEYESLEEFDGF